MVVLARVDQGIVGLWASEAVIVDFLIEVEALVSGALLRSIETAVEEPLAVAGPVGFTELDPLNLVLKNTAGFDFNDLPGLPVLT